MVRRSKGMRMTRYAENTTVPAEKSRMEIERILIRYGADQFMYGMRPDVAAIGFQAAGRNIRFTLPMPKMEAFKSYRRKGSHFTTIRSEVQQRAAYDQEVRQRWRALALCIKAKLEAVEAGITTFEDEFMAHILLPNGRTMGEHAAPLIAQAYESGTVPPLLPHLN